MGAERRLTIQTQRRRPRSAPIATVTRCRRSLQRMVGHNSNDARKVKSQTPSLLLPYAEAVHQAMIAAELNLAGVNLAEGKRNLMPPENGNGEERVNPLDDQHWK